MSALFDSLIKARLDGTRFSFYTDEEIQKISVKEISDPQAHDEYGNPVSGGVVDEALGVSAMDRISVCKTCGCDVVHCPGHIGHIKLISTCYNPFTITLLHKLVKAKCFTCHRVRIFPKRMELFEIRLQLIKLGYITEAAQLASYTDFGIESIESAIRLIRRKMLKKGKEDGKESAKPMSEDNEKALTAFEELSEVEKEKRKAFFDKIRDILKNNSCQSITNTTTTKALRRLVKEILLAVIPSKCPHCESKNPRIRKDGATKFFQMPLSHKDLKSMKTAFSKAELNTIEAFDEFEDDEDEEEEEREQEEDKKEDESSERKMKYLNPLEIRDHMRKLWEMEDTLLGPIFGQWGIFFLNNVIVSPNRFRPESSGGKGGGSGGDFLHAHSAMLNRILKTNMLLRQIIEKKENLGDENRSESQKSRAQSTEIERTEYTSKDVIK